MYVVKKRASRFSDATAPGPEEEFKEVKVSASEYHQSKLEDYKATVKLQLKEKFRNQFVQKGRLVFERKIEEKGGDNGGGSEGERVDNDSVDDGDDEKGDLGSED